MNIPAIGLSLNNRELSVVIWFVVFIAWVMWFPTLRTLAGGLLKILFAKYIRRYLVATLIWTSLGVCLLYAIGVWKLETLKTTVLWFLAIFFGTMLDISKLEVKKDYLKKTIKDALNFTVILTFAISVYSFSLPTELVLVPLTTFIALMVGFADKKAEHASVNKFLQYILIMAGVAMLYHAARSIWADTDSLVSWNNGREFGVPILLTLWLIPFLVVVKVYLAYDLGSSSLQFAIKHRAMRRYALKRALRVFGPDTASLRGYLTYLHINKPKSRRDVEHALEQWDLRRIYRYDPPRGPVKEGWSIPFVMRLLADEGVIFEEYSPTSPRTWGASSNSIELCSEDDGSYVWLYIEGTNTAVELVRIDFRMKRDKEFLREEARGIAILRKFCERAFGTFPPQMKSGIRNKKEVVVTQGALRLGYKREDYGGDYTATAVVRLASLPPTFDDL